MVKTHSRFSHMNIPERRHSSIGRDDLLSVLQEISAFGDRITSLENAFDECKRHTDNRVDQWLAEHHAIRELRDEIERLNQIVGDAINNGDVRLKEHDHEITDIKGRLEALEALAKSNTDAINNWGSQIMKSQSALHDTVNVALQSIHKHPPLKASAKSPFVWTMAGVISLVNLIAGVAWYIITGDATILELPK